MGVADTVGHMPGSRKRILILYCVFTFQGNCGKSKNITSISAEGKNEK